MQYTNSIKLEKIEYLSLEDVLSVSELNNYIFKKIESDPKLSFVCVLGEVTNLSESNNHLFFDLKDENSKISCIVFSERRKNIYEPREGEEILVVGEVEYYRKLGKLRLKPIGIKPLGEGAYYRRIEELKQKLRREGLFDEVHKKPIPKLPERIGVVTSKDGAALKDVVNSIHKRFPNVDIYVKHSSVQGEGAVREICEGIEFLDKFNVDVIILARGGGSVEDLEPFNDERVARAIFNARTPIITGIGHKEDETIADYVADCRAITPTEAGKVAVQDKAELLKKLDELEEHLLQAFKKFREIKEQERKIEKMEKQIVEQEQRVKRAERSKYVYMAIIAVLVLVVVILLLWL